MYNYNDFKESSLNMIEEPSYCIESDTLVQIYKYIQKLLHPDILLEDKYVVRDLDKGNLQREIIKKRMFDSIQNLSPLSSK